MRKRIIATLMALCMALSLLPVQVLAASYAVGEDTGVSVQAGSGTGGGVYIPSAGTELKQDTIDNYLANGLGDGVYTLAEDVSISSTLKVTGEATLDLNGYMLRMTGSASVLTVESGGHLTIADSRPDAEGRRFTPDGNGLWVLSETGEETVEGGIIYGGTGTLDTLYFYGGGVYVNSGGHLTMEGGSIVGCSAYGTNGGYGDGGGVFLDRGNYGEAIDRTTFTMNGGSIIGCTAGSLGGGVVVARSTFTMNGGSILSCTGGNGAGGVDVQNGGSFTMKDGVIGDCVSRGGESWKFGGGVYVENGSFTMDGGRITACRAENPSWPEGALGGGVALSGQGVFELNAGTIDASCTATGDGGAVYSTGGTLYANGGTIAGGVMNSYGTITGSGGTRFSGSVTNDEGGSIKSGTFEETSDVLNYGTIDPSVKLPGEITVTYMVDGAMYAQHFLKKGAMTRQPSDPTKNGYTFDGWYTSDGKAFNFSAEVTDDLTLTGQWRVTRFRDVYTEEELRNKLSARAAGIRLANDIDIESTLNITGELVLDLNDHVLKMTRSGSVFVIDGGGKLTVVDTVDAENKTTRCFRKGTDGLWTLLTDGTTSENTVTGGSIYGGSAEEGGGVKVENGTLIMRGGSIVGCRAIEPESGSGSGGGVLVNEYGRFEMYDGAGIYGCTAGKIDGDGGHGGHGAAVEIDGDGGVEENGMFFMYGGTIESCVSGSGGGGVCNDGVFVMEGGSIQNCSAVGVGGAEGRGGSIRFNGSTTISGDAEISAPNNGKLHIAGSKTLTISGKAEIKASMDLEGDLYADGGTVIGVVEISGSITGSEGTAGTTFAGAVNSSYGGCVIEKGQFKGTVENEGTISGGTFTGTVTNKVNGTIKDGTFKNKVENNGTIEGGTFTGAVYSKTDYLAAKAAVIRGGNFTGSVENHSSIENGVFAGAVASEGTISGGTFTGTVMSKEDSTIKDGTFESAVESYGTIEGGMFTGAVTNGGTITGGTFHGEVTCEGRTSNGGNGPLVGGTVSGGSFDKDKPIQVIYGTIIGEGYSDWKMTRDYEWQKQYVLTYQADGKAYAWQVLGDGFFPVMPQGPDKEGHAFLSWFYKGGKHDGEMVDEGAPPNENSTAVARYATGSGTEQDPCRIGSMEELLLFRLQVNRFGRTDLCAVLTNDIVINSGTFDADGHYTSAAGETVNDLYAIGSKERPYTGTFDGGGYTVRGLCCSNKDIIDSTVQDAVYPAGLFGWLKGATVKNLTVTGYVDGRACVGGIAGYADAGTTILNCRNECIVVSVDLFNREYGPAQYAGGIVGYNEGSVTACYNAGTVTGIDSVGGITGGPAGAVSDCYNVGTVTGSSHVGGITGSGGTVSYCYNVGTVTGDSNVGGISGSGAQVNDCFFLGTQGRSAEEFADGTVLTELIAGRSQHPWGDVCCPPLKASSLAAQPVLRWQQQPLTMDTSDAAMKCGETQAARPVGGAFGTLTYTSSDPAIASVASGVITAHKAGTVTITAASGTDGYYASSVSYQLTVSHSYTAQHDAGYHWQACACGDVTGRSAHSWVNGGCADCGYACGHADTELRNAKKASCTEDGYTGDTYCRDCGEKLQSGTVIKAAGHTGGTATCVSGALCTVCGQPYGQKDAGNHDLKRTAAKESGVFVSGHIEYWQCSACGKYFADANGAKEISREDTIIPRERREKDAEPVKAPGTGDPGIALYGVTALLSLTGCARLRRKKK